MIQTTIPQIKVADLMERVRAKAEEIRRVHNRNKLPPIQAVGPIAQAILPKPVEPVAERLKQAGDVARRAITVSHWIPKPLRGLFRRQNSFNREILRAIESMARANTQIADRLRHLTSCVEVQDHGIHQLATIRSADAEWMNAVAQLVHVRNEEVAWMQTAGRLISSIAEGREEFAAIADSLRDQMALLQHEGSATSERLAAIGQQIDGLEQTARARDKTIEIFTQQSECRRNEITSLEQRVNGLGERLRALQIETERQVAAAADLQQRLAAGVEQGQRVSEQLRTEADERAAVRHRLEALEQRQTSDSAFIKAEISRQSLAVHRLIEGLPEKPLPRLKKSANGAVAEALAGELDAFYFAFENRFRGPREEIKHRAEYYLQFLAKCGAGGADAPIVDLGCGRGEWLELLRDQGLVASGIDLNESMIEQCRERGLDVTRADALEFVCELPDDAQRAITGFHIIEHLPFGMLVRLVRESFRALQPGGMMVFESPNCKNLIVGACNFYIDPTHRNPIFPETAQFILESVGFEHVTLEYLSPVTASDLPDVSQESPHLKELLYGPRDFGVIGYKPSAR